MSHDSNRLELWLSRTRVEVSGLSRDDLYRLLNMHIEKSRVSRPEASAWIWARIDFILQAIQFFDEKRNESPLRPVEFTSEVVPEAPAPSVADPSLVHPPLFFDDEEEPVAAEEPIVGRVRAREEDETFEREVRPRVEQVAWGIFRRVGGQAEPAVTVYLPPITRRNE